MRIIDLSEPCFVPVVGEDIKHLPTEICKKYFGWDSPCESIQIIIADDILDVDLNAIVGINDDGISMAEQDMLGRTHYFFPWTSIMAIQGRIRT